MSIELSPNAPITAALGLPSDQYLLSKNLHANILVPLLENLCGGLGVMSIGGGAYLLVVIMQAAFTTGVQWYHMLELSAVGGLLAMGAFTAVRFFRDEWRIILGLRQAKEIDSERKQLADALNAAVTRVKELEQQLTLTDRYTSLALAERLLREYFMLGKPMNRDTALERGWVRSDWQLAFNHLKNANIVDGRGLLQVDSYELAMAKALTATTGDGRYVRSKNGDFVKVGQAVAQVDHEEQVAFPAPVARDPRSRTTTNNVQSYNKRYASRRELHDALSQ